MFKLKSENVVLWPVIINEPVDGGKVKKHKCQVRFKLLKQAEFDLFYTDDRALLKQVIKGWEGLGDESGELLEFNEDNLQALTDIAFVRSSLISGYLSANTGAQVKN
ncbi:hypothetical protein tloyanaT_13050 [Thalassotalea loyana]|uniref:Uncharacterized protein n=1 Tax=Thalassotalea loyana TaxID=280483 RepID=A0ABQ6HAA9_9GAMM|nr:hypothetical protein [Thalassotalea loyana]GLX85053.1 hypothetical protein tloyanaT_13050 [Thalassotalea loyana]